MSWTISSTSSWIRVENPEESSQKHEEIQQEISVQSGNDQQSIGNGELAADSYSLGTKVMVAAGAGAVVGGLATYYSLKGSMTEHAHRTVPLQPPTECAICMAELGEGGRLEQLPCTHLFHQGCLMRWLTDYQAYCPVCRDPLTAQQLDIYKKRNN